MVGATALTTATALTAAGTTARAWRRAQTQILRAARISEQNASACEPKPGAKT